MFCVRYRLSSVAPLGLSIRALRKNGLRTHSADNVYEDIRVITFIGDHGTCAQVFDQCVRTRDIRDLSCGDNYSQRLPSYIDSPRQLGHETTAQVPPRL
ncbi:MAG: hypothetical protein E5299_00452 [Burkholderia gladioli]|nr:MAG: hypothetical protein E5299_00452 [Burkholderia gladioli]